MRISLNLYLGILLFFSSIVQGQDSTGIPKLTELPLKYYDKISSKISRLETQIDRKTEKYLNKIARQEEKMYRKLRKSDSLKAKELFGDVNARYSQLQNDVKVKANQLSNFSKVYNGKLDSLSTAFLFLDKTNLINPGLQEKLQNGMDGLNSLQGKLDQVDQIKRYLKERKRLLSEQLQKLGMLKELKKFNKQVYYYQQQVAEYKAILNDPSKLEQKLLGILTKLPAFSKFFANNSQLASLFNLPGSSRGNDPSALAGLQTRASVLQDLQGRFGSGPQMQQMMQQNFQAAQGQINELKNRLSQYLPQGGSSDDEIPDFKPNNQRTKSFWKRIELGTNFQNVRTTSLLPVTSNIGLSLGYKLNDKSVIGIGAAYKMGWGKDIQHIKITQQGVGLRSYIDWKLKGSFYVSGGYEMNYNSAFKTISQLKDFNAWQQSGLVGISKIVSMNSKVFKKTKVQLMWDLMSYQQVPRTQPVIFRVGYNL